MTKSIVIVVLAIAATILLPVWGQIIVYCIAMVSMRYRLLLFIPAVFADVLYGPTGHIAFPVMKMTLVVAGLLAIYWFITRHTRVGTLFYGMEHK